MPFLHLFFLLIILPFHIIIIISPISLLLSLLLHFLIIHFFFFDIFFFLHYFDSLFSLLLLLLLFPDFIIDVIIISFSLFRHSLLFLWMIYSSDEIWVAYFKRYYFSSDWYFTPEIYDLILWEDYSWHRYWYFIFFRGDFISLLLIFISISIIFFRHFRNTHI